MARPPRSSQPPERRTAFRCPVAGPRRWGRLKGGKHNLPVDVLDESVGGFAVALEGTCPFQVGDSLWLEVDLDRVRVQIVNIDTQDMGVERFEGDLRSHARLGLMREGDSQELDRLNKKRDFAGWARLGRPLARAVPWKMLSTAAVFVGALAAVGFVLIVTLEDKRPRLSVRRYGPRPIRAHESLKLAPDHGFSVDSLTDDPTGARESASTGGAWNTDVLHEKGKDQQQDGERLGIEHAADGAAPRYHENKSVGTEGGGEDLVVEEERPSETPRRTTAPEPELPAATIRLAQPETLLHPDVASQLRLTASQRAHLQRLAFEQRTADDGSSTQSEEQRLLARGRLGLAVLTRQQRAMLPEMKLPDLSADSGE